MIPNTKRVFSRTLVLGGYADRRLIVSRDERVLLHDISRTTQARLPDTMIFISVTQRAESGTRAHARLSEPRTPRRRRRLLRRDAYGFTLGCFFFLLLPV